MSRVSLKRMHWAYGWFYRPSIVCTIYRQQVIWYYARVLGQQPLRLWIAIWEHLTSIRILLNTDSVLITILAVITGSCVKIKLGPLTIDKRRLGLGNTVPIICYTKIVAYVVLLYVICWEANQVDGQFSGINCDPRVHAHVDVGIVLLPGDDDGGAVIRWCLAMETHLF